MRLRSLDVLRGVAVAGMIVVNTFGEGIGNAWTSITSPDGLHAIYLTLLIAAIAVPLNTIFGVGCALLMVRTEFRGKALLNAVIDIPFAISPVVIGLSLVLVYGQLTRRFYRSGAGARSLTEVVATGIKKLEPIDPA